MIQRMIQSRRLSIALKLCYSNRLWFVWSSRRRVIREKIKHEIWYKEWYKDRLFYHTMLEIKKLHLLLSLRAWNTTKYFRKMPNYLIFRKYFVVYHATKILSKYYFVHIFETRNILFLPYWILSFGHILNTCGTRKNISKIFLCRNILEISHRVPGPLRKTFKTFKKKKKDEKNCNDKSKCSFLFLTWCGKINGLCILLVLIIWINIITFFQQIRVLNFGKVNKKEKKCAFAKDKKLVFLIFFTAFKSLKQLVFYKPTPFHSLQPLTLQILCLIYVNKKRKRRLHHFEFLNDVNKKSKNCWAVF